MPGPKVETLPAGFEAFQRYAEWALPTQSERKKHHFRVANFNQLKAFYDFGHEKTKSGKTRIEDALAFLDQYALPSMPDDAHRLMLILLSFAEITSTIEAWGEQNPEHIGPWERFPPLPETEAI